MKLTQHIYLIGSGCIGISNPGDCNVYAIESQGNVAVIDCGLSSSAQTLLSNLEADGLSADKIQALFLTHAHPDHTGSVAAFRNLGIPIWSGPLTSEILQNGMDRCYNMDAVTDNAFRNFLKQVPRSRVDHTLNNGQIVTLGDCTLEAIHTPAHSPDSVCYLLRADNKRYLFTGDTLFYPGHINYFSGDLSMPKNYPQVIRALAELDPHGLFPGHALFTINRGAVSTQNALRAIQDGQLPPIKPYS